MDIYCWLTFVPFSHIQIQDQKACFWYIAFLLITVMISCRSAAIYSPSRKPIFQAMLLHGLKILVFSKIFTWTTERLNVESRKHCHSLCQKLNNTLDMLHIQMYSINILIKENKQ